MKINHIGVSGGKDSTALLLWAVHESGYERDSLDATFCDTGWEAQETYDQIEYLSDKVLPIRWLSPALDFLELAQKKRRFPSPRARFCTQQLKMIPSQKHLLTLMEEGNEILAHSGVRAGESEGRAKLPEKEWDIYFGCDVFRPLLKWSIEDVWAIHRRYGISRNPLYDQGAERVGCEICIFSNKRDVHRIAKDRPHVIDRVREAENSVPSHCGYPSFFARDKIPEWRRSKSITTTKGEEMKVATIDDVVRWSQTVRGGRSISFDPEEIDEEIVSCNSQYGFCE